MQTFVELNIVLLGGFHRSQEAADSVNTNRLILDDSISHNRAPKIFKDEKNQYFYRQKRHLKLGSNKHKKATKSYHLLKPNLTLTVVIVGRIEKSAIEISSLLPNHLFCERKLSSTLRVSINFSRCSLGIFFGFLYKTVR